MISQSVLRTAACACLLLFVVSVSGPVLAECDASLPQLVGFDFDPSVVDVTAGPGGVTCDMTLTDTFSGVGEAVCIFRAPGLTQSLSCTTGTPSVGDRNNGTFSCTIDVPQYVESGVWRAWVEATDLAGNLIVVTDFEIELFLMAPVNLSVTSTSDVTAPTLTAFDFNTKTPDVSAGPVDVNCSMILTDALAGVSRASCFLENPVDGSGYACITFAPASGDRNNGTFSCDVTVPQYALDGSWTANVLAWDGVGNLAAFDAPTLRGLGFPTDLTVTSDPVDSTPPVVTNFDFNPKSVDTTSAAAVVACTVDVSDDLSGVDHVVCGFNSPSFIQSQSCLAQIPTAGTPSNGTYSCSVVIPQSSEGGIWQAELEIHDRVGNLLQTDSLTLATAGFPTELDVACDGGSSPSFSIRFPSKTSMVWDPVTDAFLYNIYRGDFSGLIDAILDGAPDGGYGSCQNANDPNPTDTTYLDAENPLPGEGFHYLVSYMLISGEAGLGTRSDGASRVAQTPCP
jgi:hypothetical protein